MTDDLGNRYWVGPEVLLDGSTIKSAKAAADQYSGRPVVELEFNLDGARRLADFTRAHVGGQMGILLNGRLRMTPLIEGPIDGGRIEIHANWGEAEARAIAAQLMAGTRSD